MEIIKLIPFDCKCFFDNPKEYSEGLQGVIAEIFENISNFPRILFEDLDNWMKNWEETRGTKEWSSLEDNIKYSEIDKIKACFYSDNFNEIHKLWMLQINKELFANK